MNCGLSVGNKNAKYCEQESRCWYCIMFLIKDLFTNSTDFVSLKDLRPDINLKQFLGTGTDFGFLILI